MNEIKAINELRALLNENLSEFEKILRSNKTLEQKLNSIKFLAARFSRDIKRFPTIHPTSRLKFQPNRQLSNKSNKMNGEIFKGR